MKNKAWVLLATIVFLGSIFSTRSQALKNLVPGDLVGDLKLYDADLKPRPLREILGPKGALLVFWASWNPRSSEILSYYSQLRSKYEKHGFRVVPVNAEREGLDRTQVSALAEQYRAWKLSWPETYFDPGLDAFAALGVMTFPTSLYVGPDLRLSGVYPGFPAEAQEALPELIERGLGIWDAGVAARRPVEILYQPKAMAAQHFQVGRLLAQRGQRRKAVEEFRKATQADTDFALAFAAAAQAAHVAGMADQAEAFLSELRSRAEGSPDFRESYGVALLALERVDEARKALEPLAPLEEPHPRGLVALAFARLRTGEAPGAARLLARLDAWPVGGVPLSIDVSPFVRPGVPLDQQWRDPQPLLQALLELRPRAD